MGGFRLAEMLRVMHDMCSACAINKYSRHVQHTASCCSNLIAYDTWVCPCFVVYAFAHSGTQIICCIFHHIDTVLPPRSILRMAYLGLQWHRSPSDHILSSEFAVDTGTHGQQPCISSKCELLNICDGLICCYRADIWSGQECEPDSCENPRLHGSGQLLSGHHGKRSVSSAILHTVVTLDCMG